jgi:hypothetical protein
MNPAWQSDESSSSPPAISGKARYRGRVAYIYAYDLAYDMSDEAVTQLLGQPMRQYSTETSKHSPREMLFYRPQMIDLPPISKAGPCGRVDILRSVKLFPVGAISICVQVPFAADSIEELVTYHELQLEDGSLHDQVLELAREVRVELEPYCIHPVQSLKNAEAYTVFCLEPPFVADDGSEMPAEDWQVANRRQIAALLTQEMESENLSQRETTESTERSISYYQSDVCIVDWDAAVLADKSENFDAVLHIMELANVQLAELKAYDSALDGTLQESYRDLARHSSPRRKDVLSSLREIRIDLARLSDELSNTTKFFGDWYLAGIYQNLSARFHLDDWQRVINEKLRTLDSIYQFLKQDVINRWMLVMEIAVVLLFIIEVIIPFLPGHR